jgi:hypothetical protein
MEVLMRISVYALVAALAFPVSAETPFVVPIPQFFADGEPGEWVPYRTFDSGGYHVEMQQRYRRIGETSVGLEFRAQNTNGRSACLHVSTQREYNVGYFLERSGRIPLAANGDWSSVGLAYPADQYADSYGYLNNSRWGLHFDVRVRSHC